VHPYPIGKQMKLTAERMCCLVAVAETVILMVRHRPGPSIHGEKLMFKKLLKHVDFSYAMFWKA